MHVREPAGAETAAIDALAPPRGKRVVDVGCGRGRLTTFAAEEAAFVYAFDPNAEAVAAAEAALADQAGPARAGRGGLVAVDAGQPRA